MTAPLDVVKAVARGEIVESRHITPEVADLAIEHRMTSLLLRALEEDAGRATDSVVSLAVFDLAVAARRSQQDRVLGLIHERLAEAGVTHTFIKGPASAIRWFEKPTYRSYSDIDVVVPREEFAGAVAVLDPSNPFLSVLGSAAGASALLSVDLVVEGVHVDVQTDALRTGLVPRAYRDWSVGTSGLDGSGLRVLDAEHDLVMFILHQGRDRFRFLLGVAELRLRLDYPVDWERVEAVSRMEGMWEQVAVGLEVMCEEAGLELPVTVPRNWRSALWRRLWRSDVRFLGEIGRIRHIFRGKWLMPLTMRGRTLDAIRYMLHSVFPPDPLLRLRYPGSSGPYLWRVLSLRLRVIGHRRFSVWRLRDGDGGSLAPGEEAGESSDRSSHRS